MSLTHFDCYFYRGQDATIDTSSFVALNPTRKPASVVIAGASAMKESLGSQVACRLALEHFVDGVLEFFDGAHDESKAAGNDDIPEISLEVLEVAFKRANSSVYDFGHKLRAGGRMSASLLGLVIENNTIAAGRVGPGSAYLYRSGELFPFFEHNVEVTDPANIESYVGANSVVPVELASVPIEESDRILVFSNYLSDEQERSLLGTVEQMELTSVDPCQYVVDHIFDDTEELAFSMVGKIGPETIYLSKAV